MEDYSLLMVASSQLQETAAKESLLQREKLEAYLKSRRDYSASNICKVPPSLRGDNVDAYEPHIAGLGPYHHDNDTLHLQQELKMECVIRSLQRVDSLKLNSIEENVAIMRSEVENRRGQIESCYQDDFEFDADKLILDSCFVIEVCMVKAGEADSILGRLNVRNAFTHSVICDIFKLENQLPLFLIKLFLRLQSIEYSISIRILRWALRRVFFISSSDKQRLLEKGLEILTHSTNPPAHLLECLQRLIVWCISPEKKSNKNLVRKQEKSVAVKVGCGKWKGCFDGTKNRKKLQSIARAENLAKVGLVFKARDGLGLGMEFEEKVFNFRGVLHLPTLNTLPDTETVLRNVMAYEECFCVPDNNEVSWFVFLMACLIHKEEDVALLRKVELIDNSMDSDHAVARMFNRLTNHMTTSHFADKDHRIWKKLRKYRASSWRVMLKEFIDSHFSKPGILCATVAAVVLLVLTAVQTYFTIKPPK